MELGLSTTLLPGDPRLVDHIVGEVKSQGIFDQFRKECIADVDTKPAYQNLRTRVEGSVNSFLDKQIWKPDLNKNQLRETLRKHIHEAPYLDAGVERIVDQVVNPKVYSVFMPQIEDVVYKFLGIERPKQKEKSGACGLKDLLPKDLDPVSPESDKNSLKDVSLESVDAIDDLELKKEEKNEKQCENEVSENNEQSKEKDGVLENGHISYEEKTLDESPDKVGVCNMNLNVSDKSDDKMEEEEEDSPMFEPIDIMNLNESNISNDSHLSGISELTSHRSRSPDFSNELSQDNFDYSNQDSQLSKVSSDSRLSIVTEFGLSNHASTPIHETAKEEVNKDSKSENKSSKDNFKAVREFESYKTKSNKISCDTKKNKDNIQESKEKDTKPSKIVNTPSIDAADTSKDKYDNKNYKEMKSKDVESTKTKTSKEKDFKRDSKDSKDIKNKEKDNDKKKQNSHSSNSSSSSTSSKYDKYSNKNKIKDKVETKVKEGLDKNKESTDFTKDDNLSKTTREEKTIKEVEKKETSSSKEAKDLKDLYKEKIRELREKKELTEKEKLNKDNVKSNKESKEKKDLGKDKKMKDKRDKEKEHKSSSGSDHHENKNKITIIDKSVELKDKKSESKDKTKRDDKHISKDKEKSFSASSSSSSKFEKSDSKKVPKNGKDVKSEKSEKLERVDKSDVKKDSKSSSDKNSILKKEKLDMKDTKKDSKSDTQLKDKKRREEKKSKSKDDHSSLRKNSNDRRSTDRDGSNGSNGSKSSQSNSLNTNSASSKSASSNLSKESNHVNNSSSGDTSDSVEEKTVELNRSKMSSTEVENTEQIEAETTKNVIPEDNSLSMSQESSSSDSSSSSRKRPLQNEVEITSNEIKIKKPKFAKNFHEAKKLMKIRKQMEKQKQKHQEDKKLPDTKKAEHKKETVTRSNDLNDLEKVPDEERVQIIEIPDEEYEEPYPDRQTNLTLEERSMILLEGELGASDLLHKQSRMTATLSDMELCIKQSLDETICCKKPIESQDSKSKENVTSCFTNKDSNKLEKETELTTANTEDHKEQSASKIIKNDTETSEVKSVREDIQSDNAFVQSNDDIAKCSDESDMKEDSANTNICEVMESMHSENSVEENEVNFEHPKTQDSKEDSPENSDYEDCRYFKLDNEKSDKFTDFVNSLEGGEGNSLEDIIKSLGGQVVSSAPKSMAPPMAKRKNSASPLTDILFNNSNNNNDKATAAGAANNDTSVNNPKKRKLIGSKSQRYPMNACVSQNILNGENFVMPLSPESDVSATSEKIPPSSVTKEDKSRHRSSQRYSSDDLYKPRPLFSSSSRRSRRSNQA